MKKLIILLVLAVFAVSAAGCAVTSGADRVKCPSCGYEFETPATS